MEPKSDIFSKKASFRISLDTLVVAVMKELTQQDQDWFRGNDFDISDNLTLSEHHE